MVLSQAISLLALSSAALVSVSASSSNSGGWERRSAIKRANTVTTPASLSGETFDYVIVGGGTAGLAVAARLSENSTVTVAVIEAGLDGSALDDQALLAPAQAYFGGVATMTSDYDWHYNTVAQPGLGDRSIYWPRGKIVGGSSAVNGLYMTRSSKIEHDSWNSLQEDNAEADWSWDTVYPHMKKSETYTAPLTTNSEGADFVEDASCHGTDGPIHFSYPGFFYPQSKSWVSTLGNLGIDTRDPACGETWGAYISTSAIDPSDWTRSYSKTGYLDPAASRTNLVVLTGYQATKIVFDGTTATGVEFAASATGTTYTVNAAKEVVLSAGVIGSPQLLQLSGVGPSTLLRSLDIDVVVDLPGVGYHLTDHLSAQLTFNGTSLVEYTGDLVMDNTTYAAEQLALWTAGDASSLYNSPNDAIAFINLTTLLGDAAATTFISDLADNQTAIVEAYSTNPKIQRGYSAAYTAELNDIFPSALGQAEILLSNTGGYGAYRARNVISIQAGLQHGLSRGTVLINSTSAFDAPEIDPGYLQHPADIQILRESFKYVRTVAATAPLSQYLGDELSPGDDVSTDAEWDEWIRKSVSTEYHPAGSCSMMPEANGGVVDTALRVYGTTGLRIIDSSIVPVGFSAHMTSPLYGIAERAYEILVSTPVAEGGSVSGSTSGTSSTTTSAPAGSSTKASSSKTSSRASTATSDNDNATSTPTGAASTLVASSSLVALAMGVVAALF